jgi:hypothetical protein
MSERASLRFLTRLLLLVFLLWRHPGCLASDNVELQKTSSTPESGRIFREEISECATPALDREIDDLVAEAIVQTNNHGKLKNSEQHYNRVLQKLVASGKEVAELTTAYKGFERSSEAADVILNEKVKLKSKASVAYAQQRQADLLHAKIVAAMMQIAMGCGLESKEESVLAEREGYDELAQLVGEDQASATVQFLSSWCEQQPKSILVEYQPLAGPLQINAERDRIMRHAMDSDTVMVQIKTGLHKFNRRSNFARATAKVVNTSLSIAALSPSFISPAAQVAWCAYIMTQGGPEEAKLLKEIYLAKRFESRWHMLDQEASLALSSYNTAVYAHNPALLAFSQFIMARTAEPNSAKEATANWPTRRSTNLASASDMVEFSALPPENLRLSPAF